MAVTRRAHHPPRDGVTAPTEHSAPELGWHRVRHEHTFWGDRSVRFAGLSWGAWCALLATGGCPQMREDDFRPVEPAGGGEGGGGGGDGGAPVSCGVSGGVGGGCAGRGGSSPTPPVP